MHIAFNGAVICGVEMYIHVRLVSSPFEPSYINVENASKCSHELDEYSIRDVEDVISFARASLPSIRLAYLH